MRLWCALGRTISKGLATQWNWRNVVDDIMPYQSRIFAPGPDDRTVRTATGAFLHQPADWSCFHQAIRP